MAPKKCFVLSMDMRAKCCAYSMEDLFYMLRYAHVLARIFGDKCPPDTSDEEVMAWANNSERRDQLLLYDCLLMTLDKVEVFHPNDYWKRQPAGPLEVPQPRPVSAPASGEAHKAQCW